MDNPPLEIKIMRARSNDKTINAIRYAAGLYCIKENMKMNNKEKILKKIDEAKQNIEELQENIKHLEEQLNKEPNKWKPMEDDVFYYISEFGTVETEIYTNNKKYDIPKIKIGNCFKTKKEAEFELEKIKVRAELKEFSFEPNWNSGKAKYYIYYDNYNKKLCVDWIDSIQDDIIYFDSLDTAEEAIKTVGENRIKKYLFGKE